MRRVWITGASSAVIATVIAAIIATGGPSSGGTCPSGNPGGPDGPDLWGGCWPGPRTVGLPAGTSLTDYAGPCTITADGTTIDAKTVNCTLHIQAANVSIDNSQINGVVLIDADWPNAFSYHIEDSNVDAGASQEALYNGNRALGKNNFTAERVNAYNGISSAWCEYNCAVRDSYLHGQAKDKWGCTSHLGTRTCLHESGVRIGSGPAGQGQVLEGNTIACDAPIIEPFHPGAPNDTSGCSAAQTGYGDFAPIQNNTVHRNLFLATTGGSCAYGGASAPASKPFGGDSNHVVFTENVFVKRTDRPFCGYYFNSADFDAARPGNVWSGNKFWNPVASTLSDLGPNI